MVAALFMDAHSWRLSRSIGDSALRGCSQLATVTFEANSVLTSIINGAFETAKDVPDAVLRTYLELVLDGLLARLASGDEPERLSAVLDLVEASLRQQKPK